MFSIQQPLNSSFSTQGLIQSPLLPSPDSSSLQRLSGLASSPAPRLDGQLQAMAIVQQTNQMLLDMMQMLVRLMGDGLGTMALGSTAAGGSLTDDALSNLGDLGRSGGSGKTHHNSSGGGAEATSSVASVADAPKVANPKVQKLIDAALSKRGTRYVLGASGPNEFDCSGLVSWALHQAGSKTGRTTARGLQAHYAGSKVSRSDLQPGDLVFYWYPNNRGIPRGQASHVEIYLGNGKTMGTDSSKERAKVEPIDWSAFIGGARPPELQK